MAEEGLQGTLFSVRWKSFSTCLAGQRCTNRDNQIKIFFLSKSAFSRRLFTVGVIKTIPSMYAGICATNKKDTQKIGRFLVVEPLSYSLRD